mgnify:CR=1 FL=1
MITDVFCKIINKELPGDIVMEEDNWIAINDIHPNAPVHILIMPREHIDSIIALKDSDSDLMGKLIIAANKVAEKIGLKDKGFRLIINQGEHGGQLVPHLHIHLLGGKRLGKKIAFED